MPRLVPENPAFDPENKAEELVWKALAKTLPENATLLHGVRISSRRRDREGDLIVLWPGLGVAFIEVKGGTIEPLPNGNFKQTNRLGKSKEIDPIEQARTMITQVREWYELSTHMTRWFTSAPMVAFPFGKLSASYLNPRADRDTFLDKGDLSQAASQVKKALEMNAGRAIALSDIDADRIVEALEATTFDVRNPAHLVHYLDSRAEQIQEAVEQNNRMLDFVSEVTRFEVLGPAGTGKTAMALTLAHRLTDSGKRVLFLCYSPALAAVTRHREEERPRGSRVSVIKTFHALAKEWGVKFPAREEQTNAFWHEECPALFFALAQDRPNDEKFDAIVVDEAQDFASGWWKAATALLRDPENGPLYAFGDTGQGIFGREGTKSLELTSLRLTTNLRNSKQISDAANHLTSTPAPCLGQIGPEVIYVEVPEEADVTFAGDVVVDMMLETYRKAHIALLMTKSRHGVQKELEKAGAATYLKSIWDPEDVCYSTVAKFKGLERNCVILVVDGFHDDTTPRETLYVGMTRAQDLLIVVSQRSMLEPHIDAELMSQLDENYLPLDDYGLEDEDESEDE